VRICALELRVCDVNREGGSERVRDVVVAKQAKLPALHERFAKKHQLCRFGIKAGIGALLHREPEFPAADIGSHRL
jgi:hypothetical protein